MAAWYLDRQLLPPRVGAVLATGVIIAVPTALVMLQPDFGTAMLVAISGAFVLFLAGLPWWWFAVAFGGVAGAVPVAWLWLIKPYQKDRILTFLDPESDPLGAGWNIIQSRSEEQTYELQSLMRITYAVFCLKKKKQTQNIEH